MALAVVQSVIAGMADYEVGCFLPKFTPLVVAATAVTY
jgi:hypothetical protein